MIDVIGMTLSGTAANESATFQIVNVCKDGDDIYVVAECVEFGTPKQRINIKDINNPVRA